MQKQQLVMFSIGTLRNFPKFTGNHHCQRLFLINFIKKEIATKIFSCEFCEIFKNILLTEHVQATASKNRGSVETNIILKGNEL